MDRICSFADLFCCIERGPSQPLAAQMFHARGER